MKKSLQSSPSLDRLLETVGYHFSRHHLSSHSADHWHDRAWDRIGLLALIPPFVDYATSEFGITNKRVIIKIGFLRRRTLDLLLRHLEAILVDESVMGRILN